MASKPVSVWVLLDWAERAAADLQSYADAAEQSGTPQRITEALIRELDDIKRGYNQWQRAPGIKAGGGEPSLLDKL